LKFASQRVKEQEEMMAKQAQMTQQQDERKLAVQAFNVMAKNNPNAASPSQRQ